MKKILPTFILALCFTIFVGCTTSDLDKPKSKTANMGSFFAEYCDIYVNKFQSRDLESYGIKNTGDMDFGYYNNIDECVEEMLKIDQLSEKTCEKYSQGENLDCDAARVERQGSYKKAMTYDGCIANGKGNRCFIFDTSQPRWSGTDSGQINEANVTYTECLQKVEYACEEVPKNW